MGYANVKVFAAGYPAWKKAYGAAPATVAVKSGSAEGSIDIAAFQKIMDDMLSAELAIDRYMTYIATRQIKTSRPNLAKLIAKSEK